jgi:hypothetical protein
MTTYKIENLQEAQRLQKILGLNDSIAIAYRKAMSNHSSKEDQEKWLEILTYLDNIRNRG